MFYRTTSTFWSNDLAPRTNWIKKIFCEKDMLLADFHRDIDPASLFYTLSSVTEIYTWHSLAAHSNALTGFHAECAIDVSRFWWRIRSMVVDGSVPSHHLASVRIVVIASANIGLCSDPVTLTRTTQQVNDSPLLS